MNLQRRMNLPLLKCHSISDIGLLRENNEDSLLLMSDEGIFIIADGLGGHQAGEVASKEALEAFKEYFHNRAKDEGFPKTLMQFEKAFAEGLYAANREIYLLGQQHALLRGMGTTFSALGLFKKKAIVLHVGDSRIYRSRDGELVRLTEDHLGQRPSFLGMEGNSKGFLTKALGTTELILPQFTKTEWKEGDQFLLCSDGLSDMVADEEIGRVLSLEALRLEEKARMLVHLAKDHGGQDNISLILIEILNQELV